MHILKSIKQYLYSFFSNKALIKEYQENQLLLEKDQVPPSTLMSLVGDGEFKEVGDQFFNFFTDLGGLKPTDRVLDVGCGAGRMAMPLTNYLNPQGSYEGFDIFNDAIIWCTETIGLKYSNFKFQWIDVYSKYYNPNGKYKSSEYIFPFVDDSFDFVFLTSVFTHMLSEDMEHYMSEIARVLKSDGRCFITFFLLNSDSLDDIHNQRSTFKFDHIMDGCRIDNIEIPEAVVAFDELKINHVFQKYSFIVESTHYGSWSGRKDYLSFQDIIIAKKI